MLESQQLESFEHVAPNEAHVEVDCVVEEDGFEEVDETVEEVGIVDDDVVKDDVAKDGGVEDVVEDVERDVDDELEVQILVVNTEVVYVEIDVLTTPSLVKVTGVLV